jgi:peptidylamidoglycolate lyase
MSTRGVLALALLAASSWMVVASQRPSASRSPSPVVKGGDDRTGGYDVVERWWKAAPNHDAQWTWGQVCALAVDNPNRIIVITRGDWPTGRPGSQRIRRTNFIVVADRNGNIVETWSQWDSILSLPHMVYINPYDPARHVWVVDAGGGDGNMQILKFTNDGKQLVMRLGDANHPKTREEARARSDWGPYTYGWPSKLAFLPDGSFLFADGYWNSRIIKYTADGKFVSQFGRFGTGPGEFDLIHGLAVDRDRRIYVGDRTNNRIQIFRENGTFIEEWRDIYDPVDIWIQEDGSVWVVSARLNRLLKYSRDGQLLYHWGTYGMTAGTWEGGLARPHHIDRDVDGNVYIANYDGGWVNKFIPRRGANPEQLIGPMLRLTN